MKKLITFMSIFALFLTACGSIPMGVQSGDSTPIVITAEMSTVIAETAGPPPTDGPSPTSVPPTLIPTLPSATLSPTELKYKILDQFPDFFFCDRDFYPVAREDEMILAQQRFAELQANQEEFQAILNHNALFGANTFTDEQKLLIYREHKKLNALPFELIGDQYQFQIQTGLEGQQGLSVTGTIDANGSIEIQRQDPTVPTCPICLAEGTLINTPEGMIAVQDLRVGDLVWTMNASGERVSASILKTSSVPAPAGHQILHVLLSDGRQLRASPGHPTVDGQMLGDVKAGNLLDGARVILIERLPYEGTATYDLLPSGDTGFYWANRILIGSTLNHP